ncbi:MAG: VCBS repeat-containing protein, partial [Bacteroidota bacterium]
MKSLLPIIVVPLCIGLVFLSGCEENSSSLPTGNALFQALPATYTGVTFQNDLHYDRDFNIYTYRNFYNGGGVGVADVNQDGKPDLYFTGNMEPNRLYLNLGDFKFQDITEQAGVKGEKAWATGVSLADVNGDGLIDI